jgi:hypothetical protein
MPTIIKQILFLLTLFFAVFFSLANSSIETGNIDYECYTLIINKENNNLYFKSSSAFVELEENALLSDFYKFIPKNKTFVVFFDFDNTLKSVNYMKSSKMHTSIELRGGNDKQQIQILEDIQTSDLCKGFYIVTAGVKTTSLLESITLTELSILKIDHLFKSVTALTQQQTTLADRTARIENIIGTEDKSEAINHVLSYDFLETDLPEYILFIDDSYDNTVKVFLSQALFEENKAEKYTFKNTNIISIYFRSKINNETSHFKEIFEPIRQALHKNKCYYQ